MTYTDEELQTLKEQLGNKSSVEKNLNTMKRKLKEVEVRLESLKLAMDKEQADVDNLEKASFTSFFYSLTGKKVEKLNQERDEAYEALTKYEAVKKEYDAVCENIAWSEERLEKMNEWETEFNNAIDEKIEVLKEAGNPAIDEIKRFEAMLVKIAGKLKELGEAINACDEARTTAAMLVEALEEAEERARYDMTTGDAHYTGRNDRSKHSRLDMAQDYIGKLQTQIGRMNTELADVSLPADMRAEISGFERFADRFFDCFVIDLVVLDKIRKSLEQAREAKEKVNALYYRLTTQLEELKVDRKDIKDQLDDFVLGANI